jgi:hypothetical protein
MRITIQDPAKPDDAAALDTEFAATFTSENAVNRWLQTPNPILNGDAPTDCLKRREYDRVRAALEAFNSGVYI